MVLAVQARGEVTFGQGRQQLGQLAQVAVADLHHRVEVVDHARRVVLEARRIAALTEVAVGRGLGQAFDLGVDRQQAGLGCVHRFMQHRARAGQARGIARQVALRILVEDADRIDDGIQVLEDHRVDAGGQLAVDAREIGRHAVGDIVAGMHVHHHLGLRGEALQGVNHLIGRLEHLADFIGAVFGGTHAQVAARHTLDGCQGPRHRLQDGVADHPAHQQIDQHQGASGDRNDAGENQRLRLSVVQVHAGADHPAPRLVQRRVRGFLHRILLPWLGPGVIDIAAAGLRCGDERRKHALAVRAEHIAQRLADQVGPGGVHQHRRRLVGDVDVIHTATCAHGRQGMQRTFLGGLHVDLALFGALGVAIDHCNRHLDLALEPIAARIGQIDVLHACGDHRQRNDAQRNQSSLGEELALERHIGQRFCNRGLQRHGRYPAKECDRRKSNSDPTPKMLSRAHRRVADDVWRRPRANGLTLLSALTRWHGALRTRCTGSALGITADQAVPGRHAVT